MESALQNGLLVGLLLVAAVHTRSRLAGAFASAVWCIGAGALGVVAFATRDFMTFVGIKVPPWIYFAFMTGLFLFNVAVLMRALRRRVVARRQAPPPTTSGAQAPPQASVGTDPSPGGS